ncbi:BnaC01g44520D [Brassica napus]|uniref:BnaC01g44520D protein n=1 Tax=Brassica napus TaxID=3708 RepID=A0A078J9D0_BRANA|nr:BnaC01g44520D [Brassica napus]
MEFPKPVEAVGKVAPPKAGGEASVKEINAELQGMEDEERYDSCKDDMSTDSQIQENPRGLCGETDADSEDVGSGGKTPSRCGISLPVTLCEITSSLKLLNRGNGCLTSTCM